MTAVSDSKDADVGASAPEELLAQTLVLLVTEFVRPPHINDNDGRDHDEEVVACLLAGRGYTHSDNFEGTAGQVAGRDQAMSALLSDCRWRLKSAPERLMCGQVRWIRRERIQMP